MARTDNVFESRLGTYIVPVNPLGMDLLLTGTNKYLNFNTLNGSTGYGFRDNGGTMEFKNSGGAWAGFLGLGGGTITGNLTITGVGLFADGTVSAPSIAFTTDPTTGFYHTGTGATGSILAAINGVEKIALTATDLILSDILTGGTAAGSYLSYKSTTGAGTAAGIAHQWLGGTNGGTVIATMLNNGNVGIGTAVFGTSAAKCLALTNSATAPSNSADIAHLYSADANGAGTAALAIWQEYAPYAGISVASTTKIPVVVNGTTYYLLATTVA